MQHLHGSEVERKTKCEIERVGREGFFWSGIFKVLFRIQVICFYMRGLAAW